MHEVIDGTATWFREGTPFALITVVRIFGSAPRLPGIAMAVAASGEVIGSVSGGCIEGAVYDEALSVLESAMPVTCSYGITDADAFAVGLTCGGDIDVFVEPVDGRRYPHYLDLADEVARGNAVAVATIIEGARLGDHVIVGADRSDRRDIDEDTALARIGEQALAMLAQGCTGQVTVGTGPERSTVFVESFPTPPRLIVFGATDFAGALVAAGKLLGYRTTLCDAREVFATSTRFPEVDELIVEQPFRYLASTTTDERTAICVLTHDPKFDVPLLEVALRSGAGYIGALGSRRTHEDRLARLRAAGLGESELARLRSPIGLDLGASTPQETAVSILAEVISSKHATSGQPLTTASGPIHS